MNISECFSSYALTMFRPREERGEDAYFFDFSKKSIHMQAVFDGCGGAGAWKYAEFKNATGAYIAAQHMASATHEWSATITPTLLQTPSVLVNSFHTKAQETLVDLKRRCAPMGVSGSLVKSFPCTACVTIHQQVNRSSLSVTALNAGDSRTYYYTPSEGLVQITRDDSSGNPDPLENLRCSAALNNLLNADKNFTINTYQAKVSLPCAIITATDGVFSYLRSPMDFEKLFLDSIAQSNTMQEFETFFGNDIAASSHDDSTCIVSFYGWRSMHDIVENCKPRHRYITELIMSLDHATEGKTLQEVDQVISAHWQEYKKGTLHYELQE